MSDEGPLGARHHFNHRRAQERKCGCPYQQDSVCQGEVWKELCRNKSGSLKTHSLTLLSNDWAEELSNRCCQIIVITWKSRVPLSLTPKCNGKDFKLLASTHMFTHIHMQRAERISYASTMTFIFIFGSILFYTFRLIEPLWVLESSKFKTLLWEDSNSASSLKGKNSYFHASGQ